MGRLSRLAFRLGRRTVLDKALNMGSKMAVDSALGSAAANLSLPLSAQRTHLQVFNVKPPLTVYIRGSHCRVTIRRDTAPKVILEANMQRAFGLELAAEQDDAGVYIVARRKPIRGQLSYTDFTVTVPGESHLVFNLTPGDIIFEAVDGLIELPAKQIFEPDHSPD
ncbi:MAG TPA: hypothetical protein VHP83_04270 [Aggregatilineaceae bacterium]|nr:hypothetical protein [Aggregatilineaceae bacterium]